MSISSLTPLPMNTRSGEAFGRAAGLVEGGDGLARFRQALLVGVGIGVGDVVGDRALQVVRRTEAEGTRVADVELDQAAALAFQFACAPGEFAADLVADFGQAGAGGDLVAGVVRRHRRGRAAGNEAASLAERGGWRAGRRRRLPPGGSLRGLNAASRLTRRSRRRMSSWRLARLRGGVRAAMDGPRPRLQAWTTGMSGESCPHRRQRH